VLKLKVSHTTKPETYIGLRDLEETIEPTKRAAKLPILVLSDGK